MSTIPQNFIKAVRQLKKHDYITQSQLVGIVAQWLHESARGTSKLAKEHNNFAGIKMRNELLEVGAIGKPIQVPSEPKPVEFAYFPTPESFADGYVRFLNRKVYDGWKFTTTGHELITFLYKCGYAVDPEYVSKVAKYYDEARAVLGSLTKQISWWEFYRQGDTNTIVGWAGSQPVLKTNTKLITELLELLADNPFARSFAVAPEGKQIPTLDEPEEKLQEPGTREIFAKPIVIRKPTPNQSARNGAQISQIIMHYTTTRSADSTINWFANPAARVSAHYLIARDGQIYQFVDDDRKAWHAAGHNANSIGIEHSASELDRLTPEQEQSSIALCRWLMAEYKIPKARVTGHKFLPYGTSCPGHIFGEPTEKALKDWVEKNL